MDEELAVSLEAMRHDSGIWRTTAGALNDASAAANRLTLDTTALSFAAGENGLVETYEQLRALVERLTREGHLRLSALSHTLNVVAAAYATSDKRASVRYDGVWEPDR